MGESEAVDGVRSGVAEGGGFWMWVVGGHSGGLEGDAAQGRPEATWSDERGKWEA